MVSHAAQYLFTNGRGHNHNLCLTQADESTRAEERKTKLPLRELEPY